MAPHQHRSQSAFGFVNTVRFVFVMASIVSGVVISSLSRNATFLETIIWAGLGLFASGIVVFAESRIRSGNPKVLIMFLVGLFFGLCTAYMLHQMFIPAEYLTATPGDPKYIVAQGARIVLFIFFGYLGVVMALRYADQIDLSHSKFLAPIANEYRGSKILDSSVIIDGRIADVLETQFLEGPILLPQFVLNEVQAIADSPNSLKRKRGRRGLDLLKRMQNANVNIHIIDQDYPQHMGVDAKLIEMAKDFGGRILTNDYNLNKVAQIHDIEVLNINDLATSLRPVVMPDEDLRVHVIKEGKEDNQGIGYLEDGTMVVIDHGSDHINKSVEVTVTRVLQTTAGRMIFSRIKEPSYEHTG